MTTLGYNWFDAVVLAALLWGLARGWHFGGQRERPLMVKWLVAIGLAWLLAPIGAWVAGGLGVSRFGGRICVYAWAATITLWVFGAMSWGIGGKEPPDPEDVPRGSRVVGALFGLLRYAAMVTMVVALLAMIPGGLTRFANFREDVLLNSYSGWKSAFYWERLAPEFDPDGSGFEHPRFAGYAD